MKNRLIGLFAGIAAFLLIYCSRLDGLSEEGGMCLALTVMTVIFWAFQTAPSGYVSGLYLVLLVITGTASPEIVFRAWQGSTVYLIIGAYLITAAVKNSGLGERIAYFLVLHFVKGYKSLIAVIFILTGALSLIIPHPWPRAFLIMSVIREITEVSSIKQNDSVKIGFAVFAASVPLSAVFLTGDCTVNPLAAEYAGGADWIEWLKWMGVPALVSGLLVYSAFILVFRSENEIAVNREQIRIRIQEKGAFGKKEIKTLIWLFLAVVLWMTDQLHGIEIGWVTMLLAMLMAFPLSGGLLNQDSWKEVSMNTLIFITAAMAVGSAGEAAGMNRWIADILMPGNLPDNVFILAVFTAVFGIVLHMILGSVMAVMGVCIPAVMTFAASMDVSPMAVSLWTYSAIVLFYVLPFQNMNILVGLGEKNGMYSQKETLRFCFPLFLITFAVILVETLWWELIGLI